ncbi:MAG TPA: response regulator [Candidatus Binatia bacterium]
MKPKILLVDDDDRLLAQMGLVLGADYEILTATNERDALNAFATGQPSVAVVDLSLNRANLLDLGGLRLIEKFLEQAPATRIIVITGNEDDANALQAVRMGAYDYYSKPIRLADLKVMIQRAVEVHRIHQRLNSIHAEAHGAVQKIESAPLPLPSDPCLEIESIGNEVNLKIAKRAIELEFIKKALAKNNGIVSRAARELGISRVNLYELIEKHNIGVQEFKASRPRTIRHNTPEA